jgi:hypothetical protein
MSRKILVTVISIIYMVLGLWSFANSLFPTSFSSGFFVINLFPLVGGALAFYAGLAMFRLSEFGRKFVVVLLCIRVVINAWLLFYVKHGAWLGLNYLGEQIYRIENRYAYPGFILVWIVMGLLTITFLSQRKTRKLFTPETTDNVDLNTIDSDSVQTDILV